MSWLLACFKLKVEWDLITVGKTPEGHTWPQQCWLFFKTMLIYGKEAL